MAIRKEFQVHRLNERGMDRAHQLASHFSDLLNNIEALIPTENGPHQRELAIVRTKLEEACFFAKRALAMQAVNQLPEPREDGG